MVFTRIHFEVLFLKGEEKTKKKGGGHWRLTRTGGGGGVEKVPGGTSKKMFRGQVQTQFLSWGHERGGL